MRPDGLRVVVAGMVAGVPGQGGAAWAVLQWVLGLRALGHDVLLVEPVDTLTGASCRYRTQVAAAGDLAGRVVLVTPGRQTAGMAYADVAAFSATADVVLDIAGMLRDPELLEPAPVRAYLDLDPAFTQLWQAVDGVDMGFAGHSHFLTVGLAVGSEQCTVPTCGRTWIPTLPPVVLDRWPRAGGAGDAWTTVANWRGYGSVWAGGQRYGQKAHSWRTVMDLPARTRAPLHPALAVHPDEVDDLAALRAHGWQWVDPADVAATPASYRAFVQRSAGELGIAKEGYVVSGSGWFSDRSACYLASGRPVVAQDTGFSAYLPTGAGLFAFSDAAEAADALAQVEHAPRRHAVAARRLAEDALDARVVVSRALHALGVAA